MAVVKVRDQQFNDLTSATSHTFSVTTVTAGNAVFVQTTTYNGTSTSGVTLGGVAMAECLTQAAASGGNHDRGTDDSYLQTWFLANVAGGSSVSLVATAPGPSVIMGNVSEFSGMGTSLKYTFYGQDDFGANTASPNPGAITAGGSTMLALWQTANFLGHTPTAYPSGYTALTQSSNAGWYGAYKISPASGTPTGTYISSDDWNCVAVVFDIPPVVPSNRLRRRLALPQLRRRQPAPRPVTTAVVVTAQALPPQGQRDRPIIFPRRRVARPQPVRTVVVTAQALPPQSQRDRPIVFPRRRPARPQPVPTATVVVATQLLPPQGQRDRPIIFPRRRVARQQPVPTAVVVVTATLPPQPRRRRLAVLPLRHARTAVPVPVVVQVTVTVPPPQPRRRRAEFLRRQWRRPVAAQGLPVGALSIRFGSFDTPPSTSATYGTPHVSFTTGAPYVAYQDGVGHVSFTAGEPTFEEQL